MNLTDEHLLVGEHYEFYKILEDSTDLTVTNQVEQDVKLAVLGAPSDVPQNYKLSRIITSPMRDNSDIIYLYTYSVETEGE